MQFQFVLFCWVHMCHQLTKQTHMHTHKQLVFPSKLRCSRLVLLLRPLRNIKASMKLTNWQWEEACPRSRTSRLTKTLVKHPQLLSAAEGGRACEKRARGLIVRDSTALSHTTQGFIKVINHGDDRWRLKDATVWEGRLVKWKRCWDTRTHVSDAQRKQNLCTLAGYPL